MIIIIDHNYIVSQPLDYKTNMFITSKQNFVDLMILHGIEEVCNVNKTRSLNLKLSSKQPSAMSIKLLGQ